MNQVHPATHAAGVNAPTVLAPEAAITGAAEKHMASTHVRTEAALAHAYIEIVSPTDMSCIVSEVNEVAV